MNEKKQSSGAGDNASNHPAGKVKRQTNFTAQPEQLALSAERILNRLKRVKSSGRGQWNARCPAHDDRGPSLSIRERDDGVLLLHCFAGCSIAEVVGAMGLRLHDLFPPRSSHGRPERRHFANTQVLMAIAFECQVIVCAARTLLDGHTFTGDDRDRMMLAIERISAGLIAAGVAYE